MARFKNDKDWVHTVLFHIAEKGTVFDAESMQKLTFDNIDRSFSFNTRGFWPWKPRADNKGWFATCRSVRQCG